MVVHFEDAGVAGGAVVGAVGFGVGAFFAEARGAAGFDGYGGGFGGWEGCVGVVLGGVC